MDDPGAGGSVLGLRIPKRGRPKLRGVIVNKAWHTWLQTCLALAGIAIALGFHVYIWRITWPPWWITRLALFVFGVYVLGHFLIRVVQSSKGTWIRLSPWIRSILCVFIIPGTCFTVVLYLFCSEIVPKSGAQQAAERLFPQAYALGPCQMQTYGTNGVASFGFRETVANGSPDGYAIIQLRCFRETAESNCGWVFFLPKGRSLIPHNELRLWVRGKKGREKVSLKAKDAWGTEVSVSLEKFLPDREVTTNWQEAKVPFYEFREVKFEYMDNFSISTDGSMSGYKPMSIEVGGFRLVP